jgi:predicted aconitase with swiveling domain
MEGVRNKVNPIALVMLEMESMTMMGVASGEIFYNVKIPSVDHTDLNPIEVIKTGDRVRVNGDTGVVELL